MARRDPSDVAWTLLLVLAYVVAAGLLIWVIILTLG